MNENIISDVFIGRQPILDKHNRIVAYELLFRSGDMLTAQVTDGMKATASVITNALNNVGIKQLIGDQRCFVNVDADILDSPVIDLMPKSSTVFEILETVMITDKVVKLCKKLKEDGYQFALDDFIIENPFHSIIELISYVKVDLMACDREKLGEIREVMRHYPVKLLAEKVETKEDFDYCLGLGYELFQGYFFAKPSVIKAKKLSPVHAALIELYRGLSRDEEYSVLEGTFKRYAGLNVMLLKYINSAAFYTGLKIGSIPQALMMLGTRNLQKWVTLLLFAGDAADSKTNPLFERAAMRGRLMELIVLKATGNTAAAGSAFMAGIFSLIDVLFQRPLEEVLHEFDLSAEISDALLKKEGLLGTALIIIEKLEQQSFNELNDLLSKIGLKLHDLLSMETLAITEFEQSAQRP